MNYASRKDVIDFTALKAGVTQKTVTAVLEALIAGIQHALVNKQSVVIRGVGSFYARPGTEYFIIGFRPAPKFRKQLAEAYKANDAPKELQILNWELIRKAQEERIQRRRAKVNQ